MVPLQNLHELVLQAVDVLELVDHDVLEARLPLGSNLRVVLEDVERELDEVVVVEPEALLLLVEVAVEQDVLDADGGLVLGVERLDRHVDHVAQVVGLGEELAGLEHVAGTGEGHVTERDAALGIDDRENGVDVGVVEHEEALGVAHGRRVLLEDRHAEAVEGVDVARVVVAGQSVDALAHLVRGLVGEGDAEDVPRHDAHLVDEIGEAPGERARLARARTRDHAHVALGGGDGLELRLVETSEHVPHVSLPSRRTSPSYTKRNTRSCEKRHGREGRRMAVVRLTRGACLARDRPRAR